MQNDGNPGYTALPAGDDLLKEPGARAAAVPPFKFTSAKALGSAAGLLLVLYVLWPAVQPLWAPARRGQLPAGGNQSAGQASAGAAPEQTSGEAAPERAAPAAAVQPENPIMPGAGAQEEDIVPPRPGLLMAPPPTLANVSYTGPASSPAALTKETSEDRAGCEAGDMFQCLRLGWRYVAGHGVKRDPERGFALINRACAGGIAEACTSQGIMQLSGHGTAKDEASAVALFDKACAAGDMYGCTMQASGYLGENSTPADISRGLGLLGKACDAKLAQACLFLGTIYAEGKLAPRNPAAAGQLLGKACGLNNKNACQLQQQLQTNSAAEKDR